MVMEPSAATHGPFPASLPPPALRYRDRRMYDLINDMPAQGTTGQLSHTEESYLDTATWIGSTLSQDSGRSLAFRRFKTLLLHSYHQQQGLSSSILASSHWYTPTAVRTERAGMAVYGCQDRGVGGMDGHMSNMYNSSLFYAI